MMCTPETDAFEAAMASAAGVRNAADAAMVDLVVTALANDWWSGWKIHTPTQWLMWKTGVSRSTARQVVRLARRAGDLPTVMASFRDGRLSLDQATTVARYTPAEYEASVCELAESATVRQIVAATRQYAWDADIVDRDEPTPKGPQRSVSFGTTRSGGRRAPGSDSIRPDDDGRTGDAAAGWSLTPSDTRTTPSTGAGASRTWSRGTEGSDTFRPSRHRVQSWSSATEGI